ncbi:MAG: hypothetical protein R3F37_08580 [Candidatus Competibacteraceae bacterium]
MGCFGFLPLYRSPPTSTAAFNQQTAADSELPFLFNACKKLLRGFQFVLVFFPPRGGFAFKAC